MECLNSILEHRPKEAFKVYVLDNGSHNESFEVLSREYSGFDNISVIMQESNLGFAKGNNVLLHRFREEGIFEVVLSNSDIIFIDGSIEEMIAAIRENQDAISVGPRILMEDGGIQYSSRLMPERLLDALEIGRLLPAKRLDEEGLNGIHEVFSCSGCCLCVNAERFEKIHAFDENTFLYNEENILGSMVEQTEYKNYIDLNSVVIHHHGASSGVMNTFVKKELIKSTLYYWKTYRNQGRFIIRVIFIIFCLKCALQSLRHKEIDLKTIYAEGNRYYCDLWKR